MNRYLLLSLWIASSAVYADEAAKPAESLAPAGYELVWSDEFNGSQIDRTVWRFDEFGSGAVNNELQRYVSAEGLNGSKIAYLKDGYLCISAIKKGDEVISARMNTIPSWTYGYFEARIKLPKGKGTWPAFWMLPQKMDGGWPKCGEIDILEEVGAAPGHVNASIHTALYNHVKRSQKTKHLFVESAEDEFHVYGCEWTPDYLQFYVDGLASLRFENDGEGRDSWPFDKPFFMILNLAWGGSWGGYAGVDESALPCTMQVDYVRVYQEKPNRPHGSKWLQPVEFSANKFKNPSLEFAPFTRWWWPGGDVQQEELIREMDLFARNHIGGVEIQPLMLVMPAKGKERQERIASFDTPTYYSNLTAVMEAARRNGMTVDMTAGSGWPSGGAHLTEEDNNLTLEMGITDVPKGCKESIRLPRAERGDRPNAQLVAVVAAKALNEEGPTMQLDANSVKTLTNQVEDSTVCFTPADDHWKLIVFWRVADMEKPMMLPGFAMNHFDSTKVAKNYEHFFGNRTGLKRYMGGPLRCVFNDSYEFRANRHFSDDLIETFKKNRGYDPTPYLPANIWYGYNNMYLRMEEPGNRPRFSFSDEDWRLRYDYDLTVSDVIRQHLLRGSKNWLEPKGMLHRTQAYGLWMDMMGAAGDASIPEMETMLFDKACEAGYKIVSSGAHLYNRPIVTCETAVYINRVFLTTPQKMKMTIDKVLTSGVNQIIWHGTPYSYFPEAHPKEGWYPFYSSALGINFSTMMSETNPFWKYFSDINQYAQRAQYVLRSGKPQADVLIYYPFLKFSSEARNPKELLINGYLPDVEPPLKGGDGKGFDCEKESDWMQRIWSVIDELNAKGITWDWINDESIQTMTLDSEKQYNVRGNNYKSLILFDLPFIQTASAKRLADIAAEGGNILVIGATPDKQPSYKDWQKNDRLVAALMDRMKTHATVMSVKDAREMGQWADRLEMTIRTKSGKDCMRQIRRVMDDGRLAQMYWNESEAWQHVTIQLGKDIRHAYWMNAEDGSIETALISKDGLVEKDFKPLSTAFLYCSALPMTDIQVVANCHFATTKAEVCYDLTSWDVPLGDWRQNDSLKYCGEEKAYTTTFVLKKKDRKAHYWLDLGKVCYSAELTINGQDAGKRIYAPFIADITPYLKKGENKLTVKVTPSKYNEYVKRGIDKDRLYKVMKDSPLAAEGLIGPVRIMRTR